MQEIANSRMFGGQQLRFKHTSKTLNCDMNLAVYLPPQAKFGPVPVLYWLSGLTCTDENFTAKAGAQRYAAEHGIALIAPDTSPRGDGVADDEQGAWDFGLGAGFYVNATQEPWRQNYQMYDYVVTELPALIAENCPSIDASRASISGHSMGGHGALTIALKNTELYQSVSAFAPICSPLNCPWGHKALGHYIGDDQSQWQQYDSCQLVKIAEQHLPALIDQGTADNFLNEQLKTSLLIEACQAANYPMSIRLQAGYDHSYNFIASFIGEHIAFHAAFLNTP